MTGLARVVGLVVGYAGVSLALRMADAVDQLVLDAHHQAAEDAAAAAAAEVAQGEKP